MEDDTVYGPTDFSSSTSYGNHDTRWSDRHGRDRGDGGSNRRRRSRSRSRSRSRHSRSRTPHGKKRRRRTRSRSRDRRRSSRTPSPYFSERERFRSSRHSETRPHHTIVLKGLPPDCDEDFMWKLIEEQGFIPRDVRILKRKDTGQNRGFGFVEFAELEESRRWMEATKGLLYIDSRHTAELQYSVNKDDSPSSSSFQQKFGDWICAKCGTNNFKKRDQCFKCGIRRDESEALVEEGFAEIGVVPCDTLLFRGLPSGTDDEKISRSLKKLTTLQPLRITLAPSKKYAYVQMPNAQEAAQLLTTLTALTKLTISGKDILVSYSKLPLTAILTGANLTAAAADWSSQVTRLPAAIEAYTGAPVTLAGSHPHNISDCTNAAAAVAQNAIKKAQVMRQVTQQVFHEQLQVAQLAAASLLVPGAAVLLRQQQQLLAAQAMQEAAAASSVARLGTIQTPYGELPRYPNPDTSQYQLEPTTGYYFDASTGLYYDSKSRYYYNADSQQWLYWDGQYQTYLPVPQSEQTGTEAGEKSPDEEAKKEEEEKAKKEKDKQDKVKIAKKIQKDMEKWAKQMNNQRKDVRAAPESKEPEKAKGTSADLGYSILEQTKGTAGLVTYEPDSDEDQPGSSAVALKTPKSETAKKDDETDWERLACLLCRRQFPSKEVLVKHQNFSELHKQNLQAKMEQTGTEPEPEPVTVSSIQQEKYRDRAKERREKYGKLAEDEPPPSKLKQKYLESLSSSYEQPTATGIGSDNIGNKLLKSMGWKEGTGLGRQNQGIVDPITSQRRVEGAGLGASGAVVKGSASASSNYKDNVRAALRDRFFELQNQTTSE